MQTWRIDKNDLPFGPRYDPLDAIARCLWLRSNNRHFLTNQAVQQRGFSRIGPPHDGDEPRPILLLAPAFSSTLALFSVVSAASALSV